MTKKDLPETFQSIVDRYPEVWEAHEKLTIACAEAGPLDRKTAELIKVGICILKSHFSPILSLGFMFSATCDKGSQSSGFSHFFGFFSF